MSSRSLRFENQEGTALAARLDLPSVRAPRAFAVFAHCFTCGKDLRAIERISRSLNRRGIAVLRFDFTGLGESGGAFADTTFTTNVEDLVAAATYLERTYRAPSILIGHSLGGAAVLQAADRIPSVKAVATIGAPADPEHVAHLLEDAREEIERTGEARVRIAGRSFTVRKQFLDDLERTRMESVIEGLGRALLIFHSPRDEIVGIDNAERIYRAARHPKSFVSLDPADHLLSNPEDARYVGAVIAAWSEKYVDPEPEIEVDPEFQASVRTGASGYRTEIQAGSHALVADEPESAGGTDEGPSPYDLLVSALGSCTSMTLRMYADRKEWPLEGATVRLNHGQIHADDCEECDGDDRRIDRIEREVELEGDLTDDQRDRLLEIADRCPVHRTLTGEIRIETRLRS